MRIAFTGSHRVGKTTLAEEIADSLPYYEFINEPYLQLEEEGYLFSEIPTLDDYIEQFNFSVEQLQNSGDNVIFDRCPSDLLAYVYAVGKKKNISDLYEEMTTAIAEIDLLIFIPIEKVDLIGCQGSDLPNLRQEVNDILEDWIGDFSNEILEVSGTLENRKKQILDKITNMAK
ncbi:AAA family ATPase [Epilithonimonas hungarica]|uniref:AAA domain-containing protein n=1 Tax=Epilithonimonas hungarica TaxID=454006 RepID=A0A1G7JV80_9FLAO|nr:AAA family ATPase [Epilithonimonas hungarica]SDF28379.1 AAA domain-containing protein [Epilithonimonas hungarica]